MKIVVYKERRLLLLLDGKREIFRRGVHLGSDPVGPKRAEGDGKTPEGGYRVCTRNEQSRFYKSLGVSFPSERDGLSALLEGRVSQAQYESIVRAEREGRRPPWDTPLGGFIMIHGEHPEGRAGDWTAGCIALSNADMDEVWRLCSLGTEIIIYP